MIDHAELEHRCQAIVNSIPLLLIGSGMSVRDGLPSMGELGTNVVETLRLGRSAPDAVIAAFEARMAHTDFEEASDLPELQPYVDHVRDAVQSLVVDADLKAYMGLMDGRSHPMREFLSHFGNTGRTIEAITPNYDRLLEYQCGLARIPYFTGFHGGYIGGFDEHGVPLHWPDRSAKRFGVAIYKVHGSVDWFKDPAGEVWRLPLRRSPMAGYTSSIIIPGNAKYQTGDVGVHRVLKQLADRAIQNARAFIALGYGFNDPQLDDRLCQIVAHKGNIPILVMTKQLTPKTHERLANAKNYVLIEEASATESRVYAHDLDHPVVIPEAGLWKLEALLGMVR